MIHSWRWWWRGGLSDQGVTRPRAPLSLTVAAALWALLLLGGIGAGMALAFK
jgi:hypothetical protein